MSNPTAGFLANKYISALISFFKYGIIFCIVPPLLNYAAISREIEVISRHGLPYDIGMSQKLFLSCKGKGLPTVIMDSPVGLNSDLYVSLQEKLSGVTKVCIYDRAGLGLSERPNEPAQNKTDPNPPKPKAKVLRGQEFTIERMTEDLRRLISLSSDQERPIMFVGSELGAMIARFYTQIYQDNISHLVLINPMVENLFTVDDGVWNNFWYETVVPKFYSYALGSAIGLNRFLMLANLIQPQMDVTAASEDVSNRQKHLMCNPKHFFSLVDEFVNLNETLSQMKLIWTIKQFPQNVSVTVLTSQSDDVFITNGLANVESKLSKQLKSAWTKSIDHLKTKHPNAQFKESKESLYSQLNSNSPNQIFKVIEGLILDWRRSAPASGKTGEKENNS